MDNKKKITVEFTAESLAFAIDGLAYAIEQTYQDNADKLPDTRFESLISLQTNLTSALMDQHFME